MVLLYRGKSCSPSDTSSCCSKTLDPAHSPHTSSSPHSDFSNTLQTPGLYSPHCALQSLSNMTPRGCRSGLQFGPERGSQAIMETFGDGTHQLLVYCAFFWKSLHQLFPEGLIARFIFCGRTKTGIGHGKEVQKITSTILSGARLFVCACLNCTRVQCSSPNNFLGIQTVQMSSAQPPSNPPPNPEKQPDDSETPPPSTPQDGAEMDTTPDQPAEETWEDIPEDVMALSTDEILTRIRLIENDIKVRCLKGSECWTTLIPLLVVGHEV